MWRVTWCGISGAIYSELRDSNLCDIWRAFELFSSGWKWAVITRHR